MKKLCFGLLLVLGCGIFLDTVTQPSVVELGEGFTITVAGTFDYTGTGWLGVMLPEGIRVDSLRYATSDGETALLTEPDSMTRAWLTVTYPCDSGMLWTAFSYVRQNTVDSFIKYSALMFAEVGDSAGPGEYLVDYRSGYSPTSPVVTDSILDQPMTVTGLAIAGASPPGVCDGGRAWPVVFRDRLNISVPRPDEVGFFDASGRLVRKLRVERAGAWDGMDEYGRRVPAGPYLVRGREILGCVTLVD